MREYKKYFQILLFTIVFGTVVLPQDVSAKIKNFTETKLVKWAADSKIISAVKKQNEKNIPLDKIKESDKKWMETSGLDDFMKGLLMNDCSGYLKKLQKENPVIIEAFAMDNKGANVGMTNKTSDYWQGDEDKFIKSYNGGKGQIHYGKMIFDESSQAYLIQISVPVIENNVTIGAVTFGIDTSAI